MVKVHLLHQWPPPVDSWDHTHVRLRIMYVSCLCPLLHVFFLFLIRLRLFDRTVPQAAAVPLPPQFGQQTATMVKAVRDKGTVAIVLPTMPELEPETRDALAKELEMAVIHTGLAAVLPHCFFVTSHVERGPGLTNRVQFPESTWKGVALERDANDLEEKKVLEWMDDMLKKKGERSVAYIR